MGTCPPAHIMTALPSLTADEHEIATLYTRYGPALFRRCLSLIHDEQDAHELVQEAFCQFLSARSRFRGQSSAFTFIYRIATNISIDRLRRAKARGQVLPLEQVVEPSGSKDGDEPRRMAADELAMLTAGLDEDVVAIAVLHHVDGMTQDEIAEALDLSRRTVGKRLKLFSAHAQASAGRSTP